CLTHLRGELLRFQAPSGQIHSGTIPLETQDMIFIRRGVDHKGPALKRLNSMENLTCDFRPCLFRIFLHSKRCTIAWEKLHRCEFRLHPPTRTHENRYDPCLPITVPAQSHLSQWLVCLLA